MCKNHLYLKRLGFFFPTPGLTGVSENGGVSVGRLGCGGVPENMEEEESAGVEEQYEHTFFYTMQLFHGS